MLSVVVGCCCLLLIVVVGSLLLFGVGWSCAVVFVGVCVVVGVGCRGVLLCFVMWCCVWGVFVCLVVCVVVDLCVVV